VECLACSADMTEEEYCEENPETAVCKAEEEESTEAAQAPSEGSTEVAQSPSVTTTTTTTTTTTESDQEHDGDGDCKRDNYCKKIRELDLSTLLINNLGGLGPGSGAEVLKYGQVQPDVDLTIKSADSWYKRNNQHYAISSGGRRKTGPMFIKENNGNVIPDVIGVGSLAKGTYTFRFCFTNSTTGKPVKLPYVPMTFFDLDGKWTRDHKSYEEVETTDAEGMYYVKGSEVTHTCWKKNGKQECEAESAHQEIPIPSNFKHLSRFTKKAAITMLFKDKSCFTLKYTLNYPHRVFLFRGACF
jgi:hypothetical protein